MIGGGKRVISRNQPTNSDSTKPTATAIGRAMNTEVISRSRAATATAYPAPPKNSAWPKLMIPA